MHHVRHQAFFKARVPALLDPWLAPTVQADVAWTLLQEQQQQSAATLLASALGWNHPLIELLRDKLVVVPQTLQASGRTQNTAGTANPAAFRGGQLLVAPAAVRYLLLMAEALGHELVHAVHGHDQLPENQGLKRIRTRCDWELVAYTGELEINSSILNYVLSTPGFDKDRCVSWTQELLHYRLNADTQLAYHRLRLALLDLVERLAEVAHHDASVTDPRTSQVFRFAQSVADVYVTRPAPPTEIAGALPGCRATIDSFRIPSDMSQSQAIETALAAASANCNATLQTGQQLKQLAALWNLQYLE